jgi:hypothetical protein
MLNHTKERTDTQKLNNGTNPLQGIKKGKEVMNGTKGVK